MDRNFIAVARWTDLPEATPTAADADGLDLVLVRRGDEVSVFEGRCPHRGALLADGRVEGENLICGVHGWDYRLDSGISAYNPAERLHKFTTHRDGDQLLVDKAELADYRGRRPVRPVTSTYDRLLTTRTRTPRRSRSSRRSTHWPRTGCPASTARSPRWACRAVTCRPGTTRRSSPRSWTTSRCWTTPTSTRRWSSDRRPRSR